MLRSLFRKANRRPQPQHPELRRPQYTEMDQRVPACCYHLSDSPNWYPPVMLNAATVSRYHSDRHYVREAVKLYEQLTPDAYINYLLGYYKTGMERFGDRWCYADIITVLMALADLLKPASYLEIGVRRGRSACAVASRAPACAMYLFDMWTNKNYAGMDNPGPEFVETELQRIGHAGPREFIVGDSHQTLPQFFRDRPGLAFDLVTVDGDHSLEGAAHDLSDVLPHVKIGGAVVFDDICHPQKQYLRDVWKKLVVADRRFSTASIDDMGYGVGFGVRLW